MDTTLNVAFGPQIAAAATRHNLDPKLLAAVAAQETGGPGSDSGRNVVGDGGHGHGLFQIDDRWHAFARTPAAMNPAANADYAAGMLAGNLKRYGGDVRAALSAYNAGSPTAAGTQTTWADGATLGYADSVLRHYAGLGGAAAGGAVSTGATAGPGLVPQGADPASVDALRELLGVLGGSAYGAGGAAGGMQAGGAASSLGGPSIGMPELPQYKPIQQPDGRDRDVAPSELLSTDDE